MAPSANKPNSNPNPNPDPDHLAVLSAMVDQTVGNFSIFPYPTIPL